MFRGRYFVTEILYVQSEIFLTEILYVQREIFRDRDSMCPEGDIS